MLAGGGAGCLLSFLDRRVIVPYPFMGAYGAVGMT